MSRTKLMPLVVFALLFSGERLPAFAADSTPVVIFLESSSAGRTLPADKLEDCVRLLAHEMRVDSKSLPAILVVHMSAREGERAGLKKMSAKLLVNSDPEKSIHPFYELWLAGDVNTHDYVFSMYHLLAHHFGVDEPEKQQEETIARVVRYLDATVSAKQ
jgi:hypothetical protein